MPSRSRCGSLQNETCQLHKRFLSLFCQSSFAINYHIILLPSRIKHHATTLTPFGNENKSKSRVASSLSIPTFEGARRPLQTPHGIQFWSLNGSPHFGFPHFPQTIFGAPSPSPSASKESKIAASAARCAT